MHVKVKRQRVKLFEQRCRAEGLPVTVQRRAVLESVLARADHPTADQVYEDVRERLPSVARTTVYRVLDTLVRLGAITKACHPGGVARYDAEIALHHHLVCLRCDRMVDIHDANLDALPLPDTQRFNFEVMDFRVQLRGICADCRKKAACTEPASKRAAARPGTRTNTTRSSRSRKDRL